MASKSQEGTSSRTFRMCDDDYKDIERASVKMGNGKRGKAKTIAVLIRKYLRSEE